MKTHSSVGAVYDRPRSLNSILVGGHHCRLRAIALALRRPPIQFLIIVLVFASNTWGQSVADAARKERERQKEAQSKVVIVRNGTRTATTTPTPATPAGNAAKPFVVTDNKGRDEKYWRSAFLQARNDLKRAEEKAQVLDLRVKELNTEMLRQSDVYNREYRLNPEIGATQKQLDVASKEVEQARKKIADLEEDLRKSNGLPGWAR